MKGPNSASSAAKGWIEKAEHDLRAAEHTLTLREDCPFDTVCFHAQQCVEKYLKAVLIHSNVAFPKIHDLRVLIQLIPTTVFLVLDVKEVLSLNRYTIEARYPGDWEPIERAEAEEAVRIAKSVRDQTGPILKSN